MCCGKTLVWCQGDSCKFLERKTWMDHVKKHIMGQYQGSSRIEQSWFGINPTSLFLTAAVCITNIVIMACSLQHLTSKFVFIFSFFTLKKALLKTSSLTVLSMVGMPYPPTQ